MEKKTAAWGMPNGHLLPSLGGDQSIADPRARSLRDHYVNPTCLTDRNQESKTVLSQGPSEEPRINYLTGGWFRTLVRRDKKEEEGTTAYA